MDAMLSTSEVAELTGISLRHVKRLAASNKLPCEKTVNSNNRPKYLFPLSGLAALDPTLPQRYLAQHAQEGTAEGAAEPQNAKRGRGRPRKGGAGKTAASKPLEEYSTEERGEIAFWTQAVQDWRGYRAGYRDKAAADEAWLAQFRLDHPEVHITRKILYARQRAVLEDDLDGLARQGAAGVLQDPGGGVGRLYVLLPGPAAKPHQAMLRPDDLLFGTALPGSTAGAGLHDFLPPCYGGCAGAREGDGARRAEGVL